MTDKKPDSRKNRILNRGADLLLLVLSIACFGLFIRNSINPVTASGISGPIARVTLGSVHRKRSGMATFQDGGVGTLLYHHDLLWVGDGEVARIAFDGGGRMKINERTFLILRKSMRGGEEEPVEVLNGTVELEKSSKTETLTGPSDTSQPEAVPSSAPSSAVSPVAEPSAAPAPSPSAGPGDSIYPKQGMYFYLLTPGKKEMEAHFAWPHPIDGELVIELPGGGDPIRKPVTADRSSLALSLPIRTGKYHWKVKGVSAAELGPYEFEILPNDPDRLGTILHGNPNQSVEMVN